MRQKNVPTLEFFLMVFSILLQYKPIATAYYHQVLCKNEVDGILMDGHGGIRCPPSSTFHVRRPRTTAGRYA